MRNWLTTRLTSLVMRDRLEGELDRELAYHLDMLTDQNLRAGMSPSEARHAALRHFGAVEGVKDAVRDTWMSRTVETVAQAVRYGLRNLRRNSEFALVVQGARGQRAQAKTRGSRARTRTMICPREAARLLRSQPEVRRQLFRNSALVLIASLGVNGCRSDQVAETVAEAKADVTAAGTSIDVDRARRARDSALASARVWQPPAVPVAQANLRTNPQGPGAFRDDDDVQCRFRVEGVSGTTPKFYCELPSGEAVKVKYGSGNPELHAEVAASRLLTALGFSADRMFVVRRVRCVGCPAFPFQSLRCLDRTGLKSACFPGGIGYTSAAEFDVAVIERKLPGRVIETIEDEGWAWFELDRIDPARGGASRAEVDALRLAAVFLAHWDNKASNQRLICPADAEGNDGACLRPLAIMQDLGATFGPLKIDLPNWRQGRIWKDGATCTVSMKHLPWGGGTFPDRQISEGGRRLLLGLLEQLSDQQLRDLFEGSRVTSHDQVSADARRADAWVRAFKDRVTQIRDGGPCRNVEG